MSTSFISKANFECSCSNGNHFHCLNKSSNLYQRLSKSNDNPTQPINFHESIEIKDVFPLELTPENTHRIQSLLGGEKWHNSSVTYSFYSDQRGGNYYGAEQGVAEVSSIIKANIRFIIEHYIEPYININLIEVNDEANSYGTIRYMFSEGPPYAYAYLPNTNALGGDVHLSHRYNNAASNGFNSGQGSHGFSALLHETLHALGLKHPGNYDGSGTGIGPFLSGHEDNTTNTVMSYNFVGASPASMMPYDILALQNLYGKGTLNAGSTTYTFDSVHSFTDGSRTWGQASQIMKLALWDAGGKDTLNLSNLAYEQEGYHFNIFQGGILTTQAAYNASIYNPRNSPITSASTSSYGTAIAFDTIIEDLIATSSQDKIFGNNWDNALFGQGDNDQLWGHGGNDSLHGGIGNDTMQGGTGQDTLLGLKGNDTLLGNSGQDSLMGGKGGDRLFGGLGNDTLHGGSGSDVLHGGLGRDTLTSGPGQDKFRLSQGNGMAIITDFSLQKDKLALPSGLNFQSLSIRNQNGDAQIQIGNDVLATLTGINANQLTANHFQ